MSESESSFEAPDEEELVVGQVTCATFINAKTLFEDESIDLGNNSEDEAFCSPCPRKAVELDSDSQLLTAADQDPALKTLQSEETFGKSAVWPLVMPVVNSFTTDPDKYDLDRLTDPKTQKQAETGHRFSAPHMTPPSRKQRNPDETDFLQRNRLSAAHPKARPSLSCDEAAKRPSHTPDRFDKYRRGVEEKLAKLKEDLASRELEQCTFEPVILNKRKPGEVPRSSETYFQHQMQHKKLVSAKIQTLREQVEAAATPRSFTPTLCAQSIRLLASRPQDSQPRHEQLYQQHRKHLQGRIPCSEASLDVSQLSDCSQSSVLTYSPAISKSSQRLVRDKPVEVYLMEDAARRQRAKSALPAPQAPVSLITPASQALLMKRFQQEFQSVWTEISGTEQMNYSQVAKLLQALRFIENKSTAENYHAERVLLSSIWPLLGLESESSASKQNLDTLLCAVMGFSQTETPPKQTDEEEELTDKELDKAPTFGRVEEGVFVLGPGDTRRIHRFYRAWYNHRTARSHMSPACNRSVEYSHQPSLSKGSQRLTASHLQTIAAKGYKQHCDFLADEGRSRVQRLEELAKKFETQSLKECVFKPKTDKKNKRILARMKARDSEGLTQDYYRLLRSSGRREKTAVLFDLAPLADQRRQKLARTKTELDLEKSTLECKFEPQTEVPLGTIQADLQAAQLPARGVDKTVERLLRARRDYETLQAKKARGETNKSALSVSIRGQLQHFQLGDKFAVLFRAFAEKHKLSSEEGKAVEAQLRAQYRLKFGKEPLE